MNMSGIEFYVLDSETNGLKDNYHEMTEICCIRASDRLQVARDIRLEFPERSSREALAVTGKTIEQIMRGGLSEDAVNDLENFFKLDGKTPAHRCIIAHNAPFDRKFLHALWLRHKKTFPAQLWLDTQVMARHTFKTKFGIPKPKVNLQATAELLGVKKVAGVHNAVSDARNLYFIWNKLLENKIDYLDFIKCIPHDTPWSIPEETTEENDSP